MSQRDLEPAAALAAFAIALDEVAGDVERAVWFGTPAAKIEGKISSRSGAARWSRG
jgi:hypothetical protein